MKQWIISGFVIAMGLKGIKYVLFVINICLITFLTLTGIAGANDLIGIEKTVGELPIGSIVYDADSLWEHKGGKNYTRSGGINPVAWIVVAKDHQGYPTSSVTLLAQGTIAKHTFDDSLGVINGRLEGTNYWVNSKLRTWLNNTFYDHFSRQFKDVILTTSLPCHEGTGRAYSTNDKLFLPSTTELGYKKDKESDDWATETYIHESGLDWGFFTDDASKQVWTSERRYGVEPTYWTRSSYGGRDMFGVIGNGRFSTSFSPPLPSVGVRPALNIKADTQVRLTEEGQWKIIGVASSGGAQNTRLPFVPPSGGTGEVKKLGDLPTGNLVYDGTSLWEHRDNAGYTGRGETKPIMWLVVVKNHPGYPANSITLLAKDIIAQYAFDNSTDRSGSYTETNPSNWGSSGIPNAVAGIRPWLNSTFYNHLSSPFQNAVLTTTLANKTGAPTAIPYNTEDKVFIPSATELNGNIKEVSGKPFQTIGQAWGYFWGNQSRIAAGVVDTYWTRSIPNPAFSELFIVSADGSFFYNHARHAHYGVRPVLNMKAETWVKHVGENTWQMVWAEQDFTHQPSDTASSRPSSWAEPEIEAARVYGLTTEKVLGDYQTPITREEFSELAVKLYEVLSGKQAHPTPVGTFVDTDNPEILKAYQLGIVGGVGGGQFAPTQPVTREQISVMFHRTIQAAVPNLQPPASPAPVFADSNLIANWAQEAVADMSAWGIIGGVGENRFNPGGSATREQAIALVKRVYEQLK